MFSKPHRKWLCAPQSPILTFVFTDMKSRYLLFIIDVLVVALFIPPSFVHWHVWKTLCIFLSSIDLMTRKWVDLRVWPQVEILSHNCCETLCVVTQLSRSYALVGKQKSARIKELEVRFIAIRMISCIIITSINRMISCIILEWGIASIIRFDSDAVYVLNAPKFYQSDMASLRRKMKAQLSKVCLIRCRAYVAYWSLIYMTRVVLDLTRG